MTAINLRFSQAADQTVGWLTASLLFGPDGWLDGWPGDGMAGPGWLGIDFDDGLILVRPWPEIDSGGGEPLLKL